jgi:hypothetical protein
MAEKFAPLDSVTRSTVTTEEAAFHLNRKPQTLRVWALAKTDAPLKPIHVGNRLAWKVSEIRELLK